jgi:hypothetical protein
MAGRRHLRQKIARTEKGGGGQNALILEFTTLRVYTWRLLLAPNGVRHLGHIHHLGGIVDTKDVSPLLDGSAARSGGAPRTVFRVRTTADLADEALARGANLHTTSHRTILVSTRDTVAVAVLSPTSSGRSRQPCLMVESSRNSFRLSTRAFANPMPGSKITFHRKTPAASAAATRSLSTSLTSATTSSYSYVEQRTRVVS